MYRIRESEPSLSFVRQFHGGGVFSLYKGYLLFTANMPMSVSLLHYENLHGNLSQVLL